MEQEDTPIVSVADEEMELEELLKNHNARKAKIFEKNTGKPDGGVSHKEFEHLQPDRTQQEVVEERENFEKHLESIGKLEKFLDFEEKKSKLNQDLLRKKYVENQAIDQAYKAIMEPIYSNLHLEKTIPYWQTIDMWLPEIGLRLSALANGTHYKLLNYEEKKRIIEEQAKRPENPLTLIQIEELFKQLYKEKEEREIEREREHRERETKNESLEELYNLYKSNNEDILNNLKLKELLTANPNIDTSFILDTEFTPFAKAIGLDAKTINRIRKNRFYKKWFGKKGGKTKRRKNKKTKRRKNKKTKRRK